MRPRDLRDVADRRAGEADTDRAWARVRPRVAARRRRAVAVAATSVAVAMIGGAIGIAQLGGGADTQQVIAEGPTSTAAPTASTGPTTEGPSATTFPPGTVPPEYRPGLTTLESRIERAPRGPDGAALVAWRFLSGRRVTVSMSPAVTEIIAALPVQHRVGVNCDPDCGYGELLASQNRPEDLAVEAQLPAADGAAMLVSNSLPPSLVWARGSWIVRLPRIGAGVEREHYDEWAAGIGVTIDDQGWPRVESNFLSDALSRSTMLPAGTPEPGEPLPMITFTAFGPGEDGVPKCPSRQAPRPGGLDGQWQMARCFALPGGAVEVRATSTEDAVRAIDRGLRVLPPNG